MMRKHVNQVLVSVLLALLLLGMAACDIGLTASSGTDGASLVLSLKDGIQGQKTLLPAVSMVITSYDIQGTASKGNSFQRNGVTDSTITVSSLPADTWTVVVTAKNTSGQAIGAGQGTVTLAKGKAVPLDIAISPLSGPGHLGITITWPADTLTAPRISSSLALAGADPKTLPFTLSANGLSAEASLTVEHGYYSWNLTLYDDQVPVFGLTEAVRVLAGFPTTGEVNLSVDKMNRAAKLKLTFVPQMQNPIDISLRGQHDTLVDGNSMTVTATPSQAVDWYQWSLNGIPISGATGPSVTIGGTGAAVEPDTYYQLTVMVGKDAILSSATAEFTVVSPFQAFGSGGTGIGQFSNPTAIAFDSSGRIYIPDSLNNRIVRIDDMSGAGWTAFGTFGGGVGQFSGPYAIAIDASNRIYVVDSANYRIVRMDNMSGGGWTSFGSYGTGTGGFLQPRMIALDSSGRIHVSDRGSARIVRVDDMSGAGWISYGTSGPGVGQFDGPAGIAVDRSARIYVADNGNTRIVRLDDMYGAGWTTFGSSGTGVGGFRAPIGIGLDVIGRIYVGDASIARIVRIDDMSGTGWTSYGTNGSGAGQFTTPSGVAVNAQYRVFVADTSNSRIASFSMP